jgi:hypothetical protein
MIIAYLGKNVNSYIKNCLFFLEQLTLVCPICLFETIYFGSYRRHVLENNEKIWIIIYRVLCKKCKKTHAVIPDFVRPHKHYSACESELALRDAEDGIPPGKIESAADISTVRRWIKEFRNRGEHAASVLKSKLPTQNNIVAKKLNGECAKIFPILEMLLEKLPKIESSHLTIGECNQWLTKSGIGAFV